MTGCRTCATGARSDGGPAPGRAAGGGRPVRPARPQRPGIRQITDEERRGEARTAVPVALGAFLVTPAGGWTARRVTDRRRPVLGQGGAPLRERSREPGEGGPTRGVAGPGLLPEAPAATGTEIRGVPAALLLFVTGFLPAPLAGRLPAHLPRAGGTARAAHRAGAAGGGPGAVRD
ncbi:hypothetical protein GCM10027072_36400 [Streptomyces bullii]